MLYGERVNRLGLLIPLLASAAPAHGQDVPIVITGRGLESAPGDAVYDIVAIDRDRLDRSPSNRLADRLGAAWPL